MCHYSAMVRVKSAYKYKGQLLVSEQNLTFLWISKVIDLLLSVGYILKRKNSNDKVTLYHLRGCFYLKQLTSSQHIVKQRGILVSCPRSLNENWESWELNQWPPVEGPTTSLKSQQSNTR